VDLYLSASFYRDTFIYEYIGEVIGHAAFSKRMKDYFDEGIRHFYFMMLQKDEVNHIIPPVPPGVPDSPFPPFSSSMRPREAERGGF
jgi:hypothetical protein